MSHVGTLVDNLAAQIARSRDTRHVVATAATMQREVQPTANGDAARRRWTV
jgi:hypothetical protein